MNMNGNRSCNAALKKLRAIDFALQETVLYLDAYPQNKQALRYYHKLIKEREQLMESYQSHCGPLTMYGNTNQNAWDWINGPWPWDPDANE
ncbi:MAG: spore coat protein CotJB [Ruminococcaceae bacterium]|nr:spore coat protein CotJB [Oscillospiraceae bacterium]